MTAPNGTNPTDTMEFQPKPLTDQERNAMRAFLQRCEVRLSTLHRIATAFIGGAGLLILLPVFFKEEIVVIIRVFLDNMTEPFAVLGNNPGVLPFVLFACVAYPFVLSLSIPLYALFLLLKDIIHFYYTIYTPGFNASLITPSFALSGVAFSPDESEAVKREVFEYQYHTSSINFTIPFSNEKREKYFDETIRTTEGKIIPSSRRWEVLTASGALPPDSDRQTVERFNAALGLARTLDRNLTKEVAITEISLARHILYLRRMILRYVKTLVTFIWTAMISFVVIPFLEDERLPTFLMMALGYLIWALGVLPVMRLPLHWIYRHRKEMPDRSHIDRQLTVLERQVERFVILGIGLSTIAVLLSLYLYFA
ncbi:MAG: hypothetical protein IAE80_02990 [Anaerolinea sp.]|nr:hypothetical protein [Anaerolinea sp.]